MIQLIEFRKANDVPKGWGKEVQIINFTALEGVSGYSGKLLVYTAGDCRSSMHFHTRKHETFYLLKGRVKFCYYNPENADKHTRVLVEGDVVVIPPNNPHQIITETEATVIEFATTDYHWDNYRVEKGDSQKSALAPVPRARDNWCDYQSHRDPCCP